MRLVRVGSPRRLPLVIPVVLVGNKSFVQTGSKHLSRPKLEMIEIAPWIYEFLRSPVSALLEIAPNGMRSVRFPGGRTLGIPQNQEIQSGIQIAPWF